MSFTAWGHSLPLWFRPRFEKKKPRLAEGFHLEFMITYLSCLHAPWLLIDVLLFEYMSEHHHQCTINISLEYLYKHNINWANAFEQNCMDLEKLITKFEKIFAWARFRSWDLRLSMWWLYIPMRYPLRHSGLWALTGGKSLNPHWWCRVWCWFKLKPHNCMHLNSIRNLRPMVSL